MLKHKHVSVQSLQQLQCTLQHLKRNKSRWFVLGLRVVIFKDIASKTQYSREKADNCLAKRQNDFFLSISWYSIETVKMTSTQTHTNQHQQKLQSTLPTKLEKQTAPSVCWASLKTHWIFGQFKSTSPVVTLEEMSPRELPWKLEYITQGIWMRIQYFHFKEKYFQ